MSEKNPPVSVSGAVAGAAERLPPVSHGQLVPWEIRLRESSRYGLLYGLVEGMAMYVTDVEAKGRILATLARIEAAKDEDDAKMGVPE